ncbi:gliding motility-associated C-terminal domain-containing protein [Ekhidna sp.]|uniref:T9SS type B sorting domain-containing protein n=1 Tax=Ekhidna sp. TaxID=2608089 RepID=UPI00351690F7
MLALNGLAQDVVELVAPSTEDQVICGAGYVTLTATSSISNPNLEFEWFTATNGTQPVFLGSLDGSTGRSQFITSFLVADRRYAVRVRIGNSVSPYVYVQAEILNEAVVVQRPEIQLCGEAYLEAETDMDSIASYQWQILVPDEFGESFFQSLSTESADSSILIAVEAGFYRVVVTDSVGCSAISREMEVTSDPVVEFISSTFTCYDPLIPGDDLVTLESNGRAFTEYQWEESLDSVTFTPVGNTKSIDVSKPTAQLYDTAYYRLTITEQNCSNDTTIAVYWRPYPEGEISHLNPAIGTDDFFYCGADAEPTRTLQFSSTYSNLKVEWMSINYSEFFTLDAFKSFSGEDGVSDYFQAKAMLGAGISERIIGDGDEVVLNQNDGNPFQIDGGLLFATITDTIAGCIGYSNAIFADAPFPFPLIGNKLAYDYPAGVNYVPACTGDELTFTSYDNTADSYAWLEYDEVSDTYTEVDSDATFSITVDENFSGGVYYLEVTKNGCTGLSEEFVVASADPPSVGITNVEDNEALACNDIPSVLLYGEGSDDVLEYQWYYSIDDVTYVPAPGDSTNSFYQATLDGYYTLSASNAFCSAETSPVYVEIPDSSDPDFVEAGIEGAFEYCEGDIIEISSDYERSSSTAYFWYYSFFLLDEEDVTIELVELGGSSSPDLTIDTRAIGTDLTEPLILYFYSLVLDGECIVGSANTPFAVRINPNPIIELQFADMPSSSEMFFCGDGDISVDVDVTNLSVVDFNDLSFTWRRYNPSEGIYDSLAGATSSSYTISQPGRYQCIASTADNTCFSISNDLDVLTLPTQIAGETLYCFGNDIFLQVNQGLLPDLSVFDFQWYYSGDSTDFEPISGETDPELLIGVEESLYGPGFFYFEVSYDGCVDVSEVLEVIENQNSFTSSLEVGTTQTKGIPFEASVILDEVEDGVTFMWEPAEFISFENNSKAVFKLPENYQSDSITIRVSVISENGCDVNHSVVVSLEEISEITFSKFISPNGDGLNDYFEIRGLNSQLENELQVIDAWGNKLFSFKNYFNQAQESERLINSLKGEGVYYYLFKVDGEVMKGSFYFKNK